MKRDSRNALIAAAWILLIFGIGGYFLPKVILAVGDYSTIAAGAVAALFVLAFFMVFWLRGRYQRRHGR